MGNFRREHNRVKDNISFRVTWCIFFTERSTDALCLVTKSSILGGKCTRAAVTKERYQNKINFHHFNSSHYTVWLPTGRQTNCCSISYYTNVAIPFFANIMVFLNRKNLLAFSRQELRDIAFPLSSLSCKRTQ